MRSFPSNFFWREGADKGDPLSPYLSILAIESLAMDIKSNNIKGIKIENDQCKIGQYADDTFLLLEEGDNSLQDYLNTFQEFYHCSVLKMNMEKTQVTWIGLSRTVRKKLIQDLSWVEQFRLLGLILISI